MLSYQHIYHAGNFADVQKHAILAALIKLLTQKPQRFDFIDTHAGRGLYDLESEEAQKISEFETGVMPFWHLRGEETPLKEYLDIVSSFNDGEELRYYPGSAKIAQHLMRASDHLTLIERHPGEIEELKKSFSAAKNAKIMHDDGFVHLAERLPPPSRRGVVLIDPSYEMKSEYTTMVKHLRSGWRKWPQGMFMIWYPMLAAGLHKKMLTELRKSEMKNLLMSEIETNAGSGMYGSGIIVMNPPFGFEKKMTEITSFIAENMAEKTTGTVSWIDNREIDPETGFLV